MHLLSIKLNEDFRILNSNLSIQLKPLTLLVGDQGCGKSSLLELLQKNSNKLTMVLSDEVIKNSIGSYYFDSESMNPRTADLVANYSNPDGTNKGIGMGEALLTRFMSHGETLRKFTVDAIHKAKDCVLLLDEPEAALSLRNQFKLADQLKKAKKRNVQVIVATHCLPIIESVDEVYSLEHLKWMKSKEFIELNKNTIKF